MSPEPRGTVTLAIEAHGVPIAIELDDPALASRVHAVLPPASVRGPTPGEAWATFALQSRDGSTYTLRQDSSELAGGLGLDAILAQLDGAVREFVASRSTEKLFLHAGVVAHGDRGLLLPGASFTGKTELVVALLRAGAVYYSDEFAVIDRDGLIHPYPRRLSVRDRGTSATRQVEAAELGAATGQGPVRAGIIAVTRYVPGASWRPVLRTPAVGIMRLLPHAGQAREEPERALATLERVARGAVTFEGPRGEAEPAAAALLARLDEMGSEHPVDLS